MSSTATEEMEPEKDINLEQFLNSDEFEVPVEEDMTETDSDAAVRGWVTWCKSHSFVKCVEAEVPTSILPKNYRGTLIDVKVDCKHAPDDEVYLANKDLRDKVARGNCVLELSKIEKGRISSTKYIFLVFALKKYSGGLGDDDDSFYCQSQWQKYFIKPMESAKSVISTEKANGEAAHVSSLKLFGRTYICCGSKNVHLLIKNRDDISKYTGCRSEFARRVATSFFDTYLENPEISAEKKRSLLSFLQTNQFTVVSEMIQPQCQHIVNLSYLEQPVLKFICWTKPDLVGFFSGEESYCALPVNECIDKAKDFGLETIDYELIQPPAGQELNDAVEKYMEKIRSEHGYEGKVIYFLDENNRTIGLIKKKTAWYVILRAIRQKIGMLSHKKKSYTSDYLCSAVTKRIKEIQQWLEYSDAYAEGWIKIATSFVEWAVLQKGKGNQDTSAEFPVMFQQFLDGDAEAKQELDALLTSSNIRTYIKTPQQ